MFLGLNSDTKTVASASRLGVRHCQIAGNSCYAVQYRLTEETLVKHRRETCGHGKNLTDRDNRQPSPKGDLAYGCSSQTKCQWAHAHSVCVGLKYSRPLPRGSLREEPLQDGESSQSVSKKYCQSRGCQGAPACVPPRRGSRGETATTSKEGSRRANYPILTQGGSDNK